MTMTEQEIINHLEGTGNYRVLKRLTLPRTTPPAAQADHLPPLSGLYVDVETTGFNADNDEIIQLAMIPFTYTLNGAVTSVSKSLNQYQEPKSGHIPAVITQVTGLTMNHVRGHRINLEEVETLLAEADLVLAHNASFDRPFLENLTPSFKDKAWACTMKDIPWADHGFESLRLTTLLTRLGYFYDAHDADADCEAGITLLSVPLGAKTALGKLLENASKTTHVIEAIGAPFSAKDDLKNRGYRWHPGSNGKPKAWWCEVADEHLNTELEWLRDNVYRKPVNLQPTAITSKDRYSSRAAT